MNLNACKVDMVGITGNRFKSTLVNARLVLYSFGTIFNIIDLH